MVAKVRQKVQVHMAAKVENGPSAMSARRQEKTEVTRARLIQSAEKIFARDGFEAAKLEEIAADAGYTRGAFYANFDSTDDLFLELLGQVIEGRIATLEKEMSKKRKPEEKLKAMREFFLNKNADRRCSRLSLEFKLFAVRHPEVRKRLTAMHRRFVDSRVGMLEDVMSALGRKLPIPTYAIGVSLASVGNALILEHMLYPALMPHDDAVQVLSSMFDVLTGG
jgi:AcrR family transcriptional regulator